jgi:hypothetical protein
MLVDRDTTADARDPVLGTPFFVRGNQQLVSGACPFGNRDQL